MKRKLLLTRLLGVLLLLSFAKLCVGQTPKIFAPALNTLEVEYGLTISPDRTSIYFVKTDSFYTNHKRTIYQSTKVKGKWTAPQVASFSGTYSDGSPVISPDGNTLFFTSNRPAPGKTTTSGNIWKIDLNKDQKPVYLAAVNSDKSEYSPTVDGVGNLYFGSYRAGGHGSGDLWMSRFENGVYQTPENLSSAINSEGGEWGITIAVDGSFLIFEASGRPTNLSGSGDLYISFKKENTWQAAIHLPVPINSLGSDLTPKIHQKTLYYASNRHADYDVKKGANNVDLYRLPLKKLLKVARR